MDIESLLIASSFVTFCLIIFFNSDAMPEYLRLFRLNKVFPFLKIDEYFSYNGPLNSNSYFEFLNGMKGYNNFLVKLISCPLCLSVYLSLIMAFFIGHWYYFPLIYLISLFTYFIFKKTMN